MGDSSLTLPTGQSVMVPGHFDMPVILEEARPLGAGFECRVRLLDETIEEITISTEEAATPAAKTGMRRSDEMVEPSDLQMLAESARIRLAHAHDRQLASRRSGIARMFAIPRTTLVQVAPIPGGR